MDIGAGILERTLLLNNTSLFRLFSVLTLLAAEMLLLSNLVDAQTLPQTGVLSAILAEAGNLLKWVVVALGILALMLAKDFQARVSGLLQGDVVKPLTVTLPVHLLFFGLFATVTYYYFGDHAAAAPDSRGEQWLGLLWLLLTVPVVFSWLALISDLRSWAVFAREEKIALLVSVGGGAVVLALGIVAQQLWESMADITMRASSWGLALFYDDLLIDTEKKYLGVSGFWVEIAPECSGIEGMVLALAVTLVYLFLSRDFLRFPHSFVLLPLAVLLAAVLNIVRVVALIIIGAEVSVDIAVGGFHSVGGWISSVLVALLIVFVFTKWGWIQRKDKQQVGAEYPLAADADLAQAILLPFIVFLGMTLFSGIFAQDFDYYYPIKVFVTLAFVAFFWKRYQFVYSGRILEATGIGFVVAVIWVLMIPGDAEANTKVSEALFSMPVWMLVGWAVFRLLGFLVMAPILEELVFRGYLISRFSGQEIDNVRKPEFSIIALVLTSVLFGFLHSEWLAGVVAGLLFALVRYRSASIFPCIVAHAVANLAVSIWAIYTANWSLM